MLVLIIIFLPSLDLVYYFLLPWRRVQFTEENNTGSASLTSVICPPSSLLRAPLPLHVACVYHEREEGREEVKKLRLASQLPHFRIH